MIIEGLLTTSDADSGGMHLAPMGPVVEGDFDSLVLRPFQGSLTLRNLQRNGSAVFHVVDRVVTIAEAAIGRLTELPAADGAEVIEGHVLRDCCRWFELQVETIDITHARSRVVCRVIHRGERRAFLGLNRARGAVVEAAILATRLHLAGREESLQPLNFLQAAVERTGGYEEREAFAMLREFIEAYDAETA